MSNAVAGRSPRSKAKKKKETDDIRIVQLQEADLVEAAKLMYRSANALRESVGLAPYTIRFRAAPPLLSHIYSQDPDLSWGAYEGDTLVGFSSSHMRDRQWHIAYLFVDPDYQNRGLGKQLLRTGIDEATRREAHFMSQCTFIYNTKSIGLYTKMGMFPRKNLMHLEGPPASSYAWPKLSAPITPEMITSTDVLNDLNLMDREVRGINRAVDHCYWLADDDHEGYVFRHNNNLVGYAYISQQGQIGPVLAMRDMYLSEIILHCLHLLAARGDDVVPKIWLNGKNFTSLQMLLNNQFRIQEIGLLLTNRMFCDVRRYVPSSMAVF
ncbi:MAG: GNAT family N-acetyltransferase [Candidatus Zixiibacteriota bacterium]